MSAQTIDVAKESAFAAPEAQAPQFHSIAAFPEAAASEPRAETDYAARIADWMRAFLMRPHPDLGRVGAVCPYTAIAARADLIRIAWSPARDEGEIHAQMRTALRTFEALPASRAQRPFRTVIVGFPFCDDEMGKSALKRVQNRLRPESIYRGKMIGLFEPDSEATGLINPDFRPLRSPLPLLAIRTLVDNDAPFVARNPRLAPIYLWKFKATGLRKMIALLLSRR